MQILHESFGSCATNCYILKGASSQIVIDPSENSHDWVKKNTDNIVAILCTHGHFDHVFDAYKFQKDNIKIYIHKNDEFLLKNDPFGILQNSCEAIAVNSDEKLKFDEFDIEFLHYPGHTPGSCMILINDIIFSGDVLFNGSVGRYDFPFSNVKDMKNSLLKIKNIEKNYKIYPGHGKDTNLFDEKDTIEYFLNIM